MVPYTVVIAAIVLATLVMWLSDAFLNWRALEWMKRMEARFKKEHPDKCPTCMVHQWAIKEGYVDKDSEAPPHVCKN